MDKALNEIRKLRSELKVGLIALENENETSSSPLQRHIIGSDKMILNALIDFFQRIEKRFLALEHILDNDLYEIESEIKGIKKRLDQGNL